MGRCVSELFGWANEPETIGAPCVGQNLLENQCIFIRGFRVARTLGILPKHLRAAAQPPTDADDNDQDSEPDMELISIPPMSKVKYVVYCDISSPYLISQKYQDPLQFIFDYVAKVSNKNLGSAFILY